MKPYQLYRWSYIHTGDRANEHTGERTADRTKNEKVGEPPLSLALWGDFHRICPDSINSFSKSGLFFLLMCMSSCN